MNIVYAGVILTADSTNHLQHWWKMNIGDLLPDVLCHHMTVEFAPHIDQVKKLDIGTMYQLRIDAYVNTPLVQAVSIANNKSLHVKNDIAHITVAINKSKGGRAKDANNVFDDHNTQSIAGPIVFGRLGCVLSDGKIVFDKQKLQNKSQI